MFNSIIIKLSDGFKFSRCCIFRYICTQTIVGIILCIYYYMDQTISSSYITSRLNRRLPVSIHIIIYLLYSLLHNYITIIIMLSIVVTHYSYITGAWHGIDLCRLSPFREVIRHILQYEGASLVYPETCVFFCLTRNIRHVLFSYSLTRSSAR